MAITAQGLSVLNSLIAERDSIKKALPFLNQTNYSTVPIQLLLFSVSVIINTKAFRVMLETRLDDIDTMLDQLGYTDGE